MKKSPTILEKANSFRQMHQSEKTFIMANAWNAGSAVLLEQSGFVAIGTTSAGIAFSHALPDYEGALSFENALAETREIVEAVKIPVSMDAENGYGHSSDEISKNMQQIAETGVVGANVEDYSGDKTRGLYEIELATERIAAAKEAVSSLGYPFMLTARSECFLVEYENPFRQSVERINRYSEAGADCLFVPGLRDIDTIAALVREVDKPVNVVMGLTGEPQRVADLEKAGVCRISIGGSLARATFGLVRSAAKEMLERGTFNYSAMQIPDSELCSLFSALCDLKSLIRL